MFDNKKKSLFKAPEVSVSDVTEMNAVERYGFMRDHETTSGNGAVKYTTTGDVFVDDFANIARYRDRRCPAEIFATVAEEWSVDPLKTLKMAAYIRSVSRTTEVIADGVTELHKVIGQGLRWEYFFRMLYIASKDVTAFTRNIDVLLSLGSEKDLFDMWRLQLMYGETLIPETVFMSIVTARLGYQKSWDRVLKYLPTIRPKSKQTTLAFEVNSYIGRYISDHLYPDMPVDARRASYRRLKSSGKAHTWQQHISRMEYTAINFDSISGAALTKLSRSMFMANHGLCDTFAKWLHGKPRVKTTSYVHDLLCPDLDSVNQELANKQFETLVSNAGSCTSRLLVAIDVSGSMILRAAGTSYRAIDVAYAMATYFSYVGKGEFAGTYVTFDDVLHVRKFEESQTPYQRAHLSRTEYSFGSTDFEQIIQTLCNMKNSGIPESDFPTGILCVSDGEYNYCGRSTNLEHAKDLLRAAGFSDTYVNNFTVVLWDIPNLYYGRKKSVFECLADTPNYFHMSGFDPAGIAFIMSGDYVPPKTALELLQNALGQEAFDKLSV